MASQLRVPATLAAAARTARYFATLTAHDHPIAAKPDASASDHSSSAVEPDCPAGDNFTGAFQPAIPAGDHTSTALCSCTDPGASCPAAVTIAANAAARATAYAVSSVPVAVAAARPPSPADYASYSTVTTATSIFSGTHSLLEAPISYAISATCASSSRCTARACSFTFSCTHEPAIP